MFVCFKGCSFIVTWVLIFHIHQVNRVRRVPIRGSPVWWWCIQDKVPFVLAAQGLWMRYLNYRFQWASEVDGYFWCGSLFSRWGFHGTKSQEGIRMGGHMTQRGLSLPETRATEFLPCRCPQQSSLPCLPSTSLRWTSAMCNTDTRGVGRKARLDTS